MHFMKKVIPLIMCMVTLGSNYSFGQNDVRYHIQVTDIRREIHANILGIPSSVDITVHWKILQDYEQDEQSLDVSVLDHYQVECINLSTKQGIETSQRSQGNFYTFPRKKVGIKYGFIVKGFRGSVMAAVSDTAWVVAGRLRADNGSTGNPWHYYIPINGRIPLMLIGRQGFFDQSTRAGKVAFHLIWNFFLVGVVIWLGYCIRYLSLFRIFPLKKSIMVGSGYDSIYSRLELKEFKNILDSWRDIIKKTNENIRRELGLGNQVSITEIEGANAKFWRDEGSKAVGELIERIDRPGMDRLPAVKIIRAGLENHELGGFHWVEVSKEVDRAIENRASSELEKLRRKSQMDWLWNLGTMAPLIGLFGTATGISHAFSTLTYLRADITQNELVKRLAGGIYEALWTTIEGLFVGLFLMLLYYFYQNKLNWIYSKWEELYVYVAEKL